MAQHTLEQTIFGQYQGELSNVSKMRVSSTEFPYQGTLEIGDCPRNNGRQVRYTSPDGKVKVYSSSASHYVYALEQLRPFMEELVKVLGPERFPLRD